MADEKEKKTVEAEKGGGGKIGKVVAVVFGAVVAPVLVTVLVKWGDPSLWKTPPAPAAPPAATSPAGPSTDSSSHKGPGHLGRGGAPTNKEKSPPETKPQGGRGGRGKS